MGFLPNYDVNRVGNDAVSWNLAHTFLRQMKKYQGVLTKQQLRTLRGQALSGDLEGAEKGLEKLVAEKDLKRFNEMGLEPWKKDGRKNK